MSLRPPGFRRLPPPVGRDFGFYDPMGSYPPDFRRVPRMPPPPPPPPNLFNRMPFGGRGGAPRGFAPRPQLRPRDQGGMNKGLKRKFVEADSYRNSGYPNEGNRPGYDSAGPPPQQQRLMQNRSEVKQELDETSQFPQAPSPPGMRPRQMENTNATDSDQSGEAGVTENLRIPPDLIQPLYCKLCDTRLNGTLQATAHYDGKNHKKKERQYIDKLRREKGIKTPVPQANGKTDNVRLLGKKKNLQKLRGRLTAATDPDKFMQQVLLY